MKDIVISDAVKYIGADDKDLDLFESQYIVPNGVSYNSYVILDEKIAVMDTIDTRKTDEWKENLERVLDGRTPDYLVVSHLEPDHAGSIKEFADKYAKQMSVKMNDVNQFVSNLSGGNKQKVVLARWIGKDSDIVVLDSPTRGIDIKVKQDIYQLMNQMRKNGKSIIMISEELMELIGMSDRIIIMKDGKISGELERNQNLDENGLISMMV
mgnify:CR=1 FL=1